MDLSYRIISAESDLKDKLETFFKDIFIGTNLESHGLDHHRRVWNNAKYLLNYKAVSDKIIDPGFPAKLIIASYLHDTGMAVDAGPEHGIHSSHFCERFLKKYNLPEDFKDVTEAVLNHDKKDYNSGESPSSLLSILSVADDIDAFGHIGIYRYLEIYLIRNIPSGQIGIAIRENAKKRFVNLETSLALIPEYIEKQRVRFEILDEFFLNYNKEVSVTNGLVRNPWTGYTGVAELIGWGLQKNLTTDQLINHVAENNFDTVIKTYFSQLRNEISLSWIGSKG